MEIHNLSHNGENEFTFINAMSGLKYRDPEYPFVIGLKDFKKLKGIMAGICYFPNCYRPKIVAALNSVEQWKEIKQNFENAEVKGEGEDKPKNVALRFDTIFGDDKGLKKGQTVAVDNVEEALSSIEREEHDWIAIVELYDDVNALICTKTQGGFNIMKRRWKFYY